MKIQKPDQSHPSLDVRGLRVGLGYDVHRITAPSPERPHLILGGVAIDCDFVLQGHSDADALLHAIVDALLGAAHMGDIGELFPDDDPRNALRDSAVFLTHTRDLLRQAGWTIANLDCVVIAERPKLSVYKPRMEQRIAQLLDIDVSCVNVKAKTNEQMDAVGEGKGIGCQAVVLLFS